MLVSEPSPCSFCVLVLDPPGSREAQALAQVDRGQREELEGVCRELSLERIDDRADWLRAPLLVISVGAQGAARATREGRTG